MKTTMCVVRWSAFLCTILLVLCGCTSTEEPPQYVYGEAAVTGLEIVITDSFPIQVVAVVYGELPDACTKIDSVSQELKDRTFVISLTTRRPVNEVCALTVIPFEASVPLAVLGLETGVYSVSAGELSEIFRLTKDNATRPEDSEGIL